MSEFPKRSRNYQRGTSAAILPFKIGNLRQRCVYRPMRGAYAGSWPSTKLRAEPSGFPRVSHQVLRECRRSHFVPLPQLERGEREPAARWV